MGSSTRSEQSQSELRKRRKYVRNACVNCRLRKVKCSGEATCSQCQADSVECEYPASQKRRKAAGDSALHQGQDEVQTAQEQELARIMARIRDLEANYSMLCSQMETSPPQGRSQGTISDLQESNPSPCTDSAFATLTDRDGWRGSTSFVAQLSTLDRSLAREPMPQDDFHAESRATSPPNVTWSDLPRSTEMTLTAVERETRLNDMEGILQSIDTFFFYLNTHYPCINENSFRSLFDKFLAGEELHELSYADRQQFIALVNLIHAEVRMLSEEWSTSARAPAWEAFCRAESILGRLTWLGNGNLLTIQCLVIKARYLLYAEKAHGAYDTMGRVVRLCWLMGLHCQPSWVGLTPFEVIMRQRIFWTVFYIDRHVALMTGAPYLIRQCDVDVDLPPDIDDCLLHEGQPPPPIAVSTGPSSHPYLSSAREWACLASEIWDVMCGINAQRPTSAELIATLDARICFKLGQMPMTLRWGTNIPKLDGDSATPHYVIRQSAILTQRMNLLRLLLRQERMLNMTFDDEMARDCIAIATENINNIHNIYNSSSHIPLDRFSSCFCLTASLLPLICVIVKTTSDPGSRTESIDAYRKAMALLQDMAPTFSAARHALLRMRRLTRTTERAIRRFHLAEQFPFDPQEFALENLVPQISGFFSAPDPQQDWEVDFLNGDLDGPFHLNLNHIL